VFKLLKPIAWLAVVAALVFSFDVASAQSGEDDPAQVEAGMATFEANCAACHSSDGTGSATGRPLTDIAIEQPDRSVLITSVTDGKGNMPTWGAVLSAEEIDAVVSYVRIGFASQPAEEEAEEEEAAAEEELAVTGTETPFVLILGAALVAAGLLFVSSAQLRTRRN
jgi:cytochrome c6